MNNLQEKKERKPYRKISNLIQKIKFIRYSIKSKNSYQISFPIVITFLSTLPHNRLVKDIENMIPFFSNFQYLNSFFSLLENDLTIHELFYEFGLILLHQAFKKNQIVKRYGEKTNIFFILLTGSLSILDIQFTKENVSVMEYLTYLVKLELLHEDELLKKMKILNYDYFPFKEARVAEYLKNHSEYEYTYDILKKRAQIELSQYHIVLNTYDNEVPNIDDYIEMTALNKNNFNFSESLMDLQANKKKFFFFPRYVKIRDYNNNDFFGDLIPTSKRCIEEYTFISTNLTYLGYIDKNKFKESKIFQIIANKMRKILTDNQRNFYIFQNIPCNTFLSQYAPLISLKTYFKGDKLFTQNSLYKGIFFLLDGEVDVYSHISYNEMDNLVASLERALDNIVECYCPLRSSSDVISNLGKTLFNPLYQTETFLNNAKVKKKILFFKIVKKEVFGLNDYYNSKTNLYHFEAECVSENATFLVITKDIFQNLMSREPSIVTQIVQLVENKVKYLIKLIKEHKEKFVESIKKKLYLAKFQKVKETINIKEIKKSLLFECTQSSFNSGFSKKGMLTSYKNKNWTSFSPKRTFYSVNNVERNYMKTFNNETKNKNRFFFFNNKKNIDNNYAYYEPKKTIREFPFIIPKLQNSTNYSLNTNS